MLVEVPARTEDELRFLVVGIVDGGQFWSAGGLYSGAPGKTVRPRVAAAAPIRRSNVAREAAAAPTARER
jgi:hypothetical protein